MPQNTTVSDERTMPGNLEEGTADKQDILHPHDIDSTISVNRSTPSPGQPESGSEDSSNDVSAASESDDSSNYVSAASESSEAWCSNSDSETVHSKMILRSGKRKGCTTNSIVFTYAVRHYENGETSRKFEMATDLHSLLPCKQLTAGVMDFFIYRFMGAAVGAVFTFGCPIFHGIEAAVVAQKGSNIALDMMSNFNWNVYPYLLLPVVKNNHISLLICEHPMTTNTIIYHIDSLGCTDGGHKAKELFEAMQWFLEKVSQKSRTDVPLYSYKTAPLQSNSYDCGVVTLHYLDKIRRYLMQHKPISLLHDIEKQCSGFGSAKAERARARMHTKLQQDIAKPIELD
ncbi:hypothetical protein F444_08639 [Phytophthora nicotianae P1976]|uniref:Ubiquitin-like protease family profile domain-containing protein n=1 Tax=Phytophthora nicotianae P1976 TaxID=1317066 RepID=A0A081AAJ6_PHYNI|nr:hypothetical protein F444_08639 [Phytophthora nicotianae P1976]